MAYKKKDESAEDVIKRHQGLSGNELVQSIAFNMLNLKNQLEEISAERMMVGRSANKVENEIFRPFRKSVRDLLSLTEPDIKEQALVDEIKKYLNEPYGSYPTVKLTELAQRLYMHLRKLRIIWISWEHDEESLESKMKRW
jgi:hypothetical protein